ncbi:hypothetical protein KSS87_017675 [Heliosperma pusillum]|nr:hypothetical protein KSS87_017675 [Heliosperma pusillum]
MVMGLLTPALVGRFVGGGEGMVVASSVECYGRCGTCGGDCRLLSLFSCHTNLDSTSVQLHVHGEKFNQPIFHCNNISGFVEPVVPETENRALHSTHAFKILFKDGGCGTFVPLFFNLMNSVRQYNQQVAPSSEPRVDPLRAAQTPVDDMMRHAYVDPNDPTKIFLQQPTPESNLRRRTYHSQPGGNAI